MARRNRLPKSKAKRGSGNLAALLVLLCLVGLGIWLWWKSQTLPPRRTQTQTQGTVRVTPPATNRVSPPPRPTSGLSATKAQSTAIRPATNVPPFVIRPATNLSPRIVEPSLPADNGFPRPPQNVLEAQVALSRRGIASGSIDGVNGSQTRAGLLAFQRHNGLPETMELDATTRSALVLHAPPLTNYLITSNDLERLQPLSKTWLGKSEQTALDYETILELVAERGHASPNLIRRLNPGVDWTNVIVGTAIQIPAVDYPKPTNKAGFIVISLGEKKLQAFDANTNLLAHFPCSIAARVEKRPAGEMRVTAIAEDPNYTFNPEVFPESAEARELNRKIILPPGPNNPVGTAWISLDLPGYGIHGTPSPEQVGRTESHGCFRLANWNASYLLRLVWIGMPVYVEP